MGWKSQGWETVPPTIGSWIQTEPACAGWLSACHSWVVGIFRLPQSSGSGLWGLRSLDLCPSGAMGLAQLGPDYLQGLRCSKEAEPLLRPPSESEFVALSGLINEVGRGDSCSVTQRTLLASCMWTEGQMACVPCSVGQAT